MKPILTQGKKRKLVEENDASIDKTEYKISDVITEKNLYTLFFTLKVNKKIKSLFVSMNYPYTYETLMEYL